MFLPVSFSSQISAHGNDFQKSAWYSVWQGRRTFDLFGERDEKIHGAQRRLVAQPYSMTALYDVEDYVDNAIKVFLKRMEDIRGQGSIDLGKWLQLLAFGQYFN